MELAVVPKAIHCQPNATVRDALRILQKSSMGSVVVAEGLKVVGIFTERDYLLKIAGKAVDIDKTPISNFMTRDPVCVKKQATIGEALAVMHKGNFRHVIVVDSYNNLERIFSVKDVASYFVDIVSQAAPKVAA